MNVFFLLVMLMLENGFFVEIRLFKRYCWKLFNENFMGVCLLRSHGEVALTSLGVFDHQRTNVIIRASRTEEENATARESARIGTIERPGRKSWSEDVKFLLRIFLKPENIVWLLNENASNNNDCLLRISNAHPFDLSRRVSFSKCISLYGNIFICFAAVDSSIGNNEYIVHIHKRLVENQCISVFQNINLRVKSKVFELYCVHLLRKFLFL